MLVHRHPHFDYLVQLHVELWPHLGYQLQASLVNAPQLQFTSLVPHLLNSEVPQPQFSELVYYLYVSSVLYHLYLFYME